MPRVISVNTGQSQVSTDVAVIAADGVEACTVNVSVNQSRTDSDGEPLPVQRYAASQVTVAVTPSTGVTVTQPTGTSDESGTVTASFVSTNATTVSVSATAFGVAVGNTASVVVGTGDPVGTSYETGFEDTTFAALDSDGWVWGGSTRTTLSTDNPRTGLRSMRMAYQAAAAGADSRAQQNFNFGQNVTEFWMEWYVYLPANYTTRSGESPSNNKWFRVWGDDYNSGNKIGASTDYNASYDDNTRLRFEYIYKGYADGLIGFGPSGSQSPATSFGGTMKSAWTRVRVHCKMVTAAENDGVMELWFGNTKVIDFQSINAKYDDVAYWNQGYLFGAANSGFLNETIIYVDDWKWYASDPGWTF